MILLPVLNVTPSSISHYPAQRCHKLVSKLPPRLGWVVKLSPHKTLVNIRPISWEIPLICFWFRQSLALIGLGIVKKYQCMVAGAAGRASVALHNTWYYKLGVYFGGRRGVSHRKRALLPLAVNCIVLCASISRARLSAHRRRPRRSPIKMTFSIHWR